MENIYFKPRYSPAFFLRHLVIGFIGIGFACLYFSKAITSWYFDALFILGSISCSLYYFRFPLAFIKEIIFGERIAIKRYLWPVQITDYSNLQDSNENAIKIGFYTIRYFWFENPEELQKDIDNLLKLKLLDETQVENGKLHSEYQIQSKALRLSLFLTLGLSLLLQSIWPYFGWPINRFVEFIGVFAIAWIIYWFQLVIPSFSLK